VIGFNRKLLLLWEQEEGDRWSKEVSSCRNTQPDREGTEAYVVLLSDAYLSATSGFAKKILIAYACSLPYFYIFVYCRDEGAR